MKVVSLEKVIEVLEWAKYQEHIRGDIDVVIENIEQYAEEK